MPVKRKSIAIEVKTQVLHEAGYKCSNPTCRTIITLDIHHMDYVSKGGGNIPSNLLALCPNCHQLHHIGHIPLDSIRAWKMLQLTLNEAFDKKSIDILLALDRIGGVIITGDGLLNCAGLIASNLIYVTENWIGTEKQKETYGMGLSIGAAWRDVEKPLSIGQYRLSLTNKGKLLLAAWKNGNQSDAVNIVSKT